MTDSNQDPSFRKKPQPILISSITYFHIISLIDQIKHTHTQSNIKIQSLNKKIQSLIRFKANIDLKLNKNLKQDKPTKKIKTLRDIHTYMHIQRSRLRLTVK